MNSKPFVTRKDYPIPAKFNLIILICSTSLSVFLLYLAAHVDSVIYLLLIAVAFSYIGNTTFALLHEATHGNLHPNKKINRYLGVYSAAFFPTTYTMQQFYHLGHHKRNRTDAEMFDLYYPGDNIFLKKFIIWGTVLGVYWATPFISSVLFFIHPKWLLSSEIKDSEAFRSLKASPMLGGLSGALKKVSRIRLEFLFTVSLHCALFYFLDLTFSSWILCYWFFGINWGSLQYADHVNSVRDIREGAWNLKVNPLTRWIFLNYHIHLVHHRYPNLPWIHLPKLVDPKDPMPTYTSKLYEFVTGPVLATQPSPKPNHQLNEVINSSITTELHP